MSDLISRRVAIDAVNAYLGLSAVSRTIQNMTSIQEILKKLPSAQPDLCDGCDRYGASCVGEGCGKLEMSEVAKDTNVPINDCISRQAAIDEIGEWIKAFLEQGHRESAADACLIQDGIIQLPSAQPEIKPIDYQDCANAMLRMWMDKVVTDGEYNRIMDKLNAFWRTRNEQSD